MSILLIVIRSIPYLVLVPVHTSECTDMTEDVLQCIGQLERVDVAKTELHVRIDDQLRETEDFSAQVESISESRLLTLLRCQRLDRLQVHVVVEMEVVQVLSVNEEIQHVEALPAHLQACLDPVDGGLLEELGLLQTA